MRALWLIPVLALGLSACAAPGPETASPQSPGTEALQGFDVEAMGACVRENANPNELLVLRSGGMPAQQMTNAILQRPETVACLGARGIALPGPPA